MPDAIDMVHAVVEDLEALDRAQEREMVPRRFHRDADFHIPQFADDPAVDQILGRHDKRGKAQLEIDGSHQPPLTADLQDLARLVHGLAHRLLDEHRRTFRQAPQDPREKIGRQGQIKHRPLRCSGHQFIQVSRHVRYAELGREVLGLLPATVGDGMNRKPGQGISRQVRIAHDAAGPDDAYWARAVRKSGGVARFEHFIFEQVVYACNTHPCPVWNLPPAMPHRP